MSERAIIIKKTQSSHNNRQLKMLQTANIQIISSYVLR